MKITKEKFGGRIRGSRKAQGLTLQELADRAGTSKGHLSDVETGKVNVTLVSAQKITNALNYQLWKALKGIEEALDGQE